jgi:predicted nucleic acid-binding Zn ribbon protein
MTFTYECSSCKAKSDCDFRIGQAPRKVSCSKCGKDAMRVYEATAVAFKGTGWPSKSFTFSREMREKNNISRSKMADSNPSVHDI